jgi:gliding motility-associated-like protein
MRHGKLFLWLIFFAVALPVRAQNLILNPSNELPLPNAEIPFWQEISGSWGQQFDTPPPFDGFLYFAANIDPVAQLRQDIDLQFDSCVIDAGLRTLTFQGRLRSFNQTPADSGKVRIGLLDAGGTLLYQWESPFIGSIQNWTLRTQDIAVLPGSRTLRLDLIAVRHNGNTNDAFFDDLSLEKSNSTECDCAGVAGGNFVVDQCGECLSMSDPDFNTTCADCAGVPNGNSVIDLCGDCRLPNDPDFNSACSDCAGVPFGNAIVDLCGVCRVPDDPLLNSTCLDCFGVPNGLAIVDDCGVCRQPDDPAWNSSCLDCLGDVNGLAVVDSCGRCLYPDDAEFNQQCQDCLGVYNGTAVLDKCGVCLQPTDPAFNQSCITGFYLPNAFTPDNDGVNDRLIPVFTETPDEVELSIYDVWGVLIYTESGKSPAWDGSINQGDYYANLGLYVVTVKWREGANISEFRSHVTLIR